MALFGSKSLLKEGIDSLSEQPLLIIPITILALIIGAAVGGLAYTEILVLGFHRIIDFYVGTALGSFIGIMVSLIIISMLKIASPKALLKDIYSMAIHEEKTIMKIELLRIIKFAITKNHEHNDTKKEHQVLLQKIDNIMNDIDPTARIELKFEVIYQFIDKLLQTSGKEIEIHSAVKSLLEKQFNQSKNGRDLRSATENITQVLCSSH